MLKLSNTSRGWVALACALWVVLLVAMIFIPLSNKNAQAANITPTNSLTRSVAQLNPQGDALAAQMIDASRVYDPEKYVGFTTLCPAEPQELRDSKLEAFHATADELELDENTGYMVLLPADENAKADFDKVDLRNVDICQQPATSAYPLQSPLMVAKQNGQWVMGLTQ